MKEAVVIGAGFGGLAEAIRLQARGVQVTVVDKRSGPGGRAYQFVRDGYTFDMGPSLITAPFIIDRVFAAAGRRMADYLDLIPLDPFYRIYFGDRSVIDYTRDPDLMKEQMARFNPADAAAYDSFFRHVKKIYDAVITDGLGSTPFLTAGTMARFAPRALRLGALQPAHSFVRHYFTDERHRFLFSFHPLFIGGNPFRVPGIYTMIPYLEREGGVWFAKGGMYSLVRAFAKLFEEMGGKLRMGSEVQEIIVENGTATGVRTSHGTIRADAVVSNADAVATYGQLLGNLPRRRWNNRTLSKLHLSMSCFLIYLGVRARYPRLLHHTLILSKRYKELVGDIFDRKILADDFSMYLHVPTRTDPSMAPEGCESMYVLIPVPHLGGGIDWIREAGPFRDRVLRFLEEDFGLADLRGRIEIMEVFTPLDFQKELNAVHGNAFSIEPRLLQSAYFRPHNRSEEVRRLYLVGAGTHPGGGVPGVLLSAEATEACVVEDLGLPLSLRRRMSVTAGT